MKRGTYIEKVSVLQQNKEIPWKAVKTKNNSKIHQADEINTLTVNNQFKCLEQQQIDITIETDEAENMNTEISTEKVGNKINMHQNKSKIPNRENRRPNNCITEKYLQNDKHIEKRNQVSGNRNYADITAFEKKTNCWGQSLKEN